MRAQPYCVRRRVVQTSSWVAAHSSVIEAVFAFSAPFGFDDSVCSSTFKHGATLCLRVAMAEADFTF